VRDKMDKTIGEINREIREALRKIKDKRIK